MHDASLGAEDSSTDTVLDRIFPAANSAMIRCTMSSMSTIIEHSRLLSTRQFRSTPWTSSSGSLSPLLLLVDPRRSWQGTWSDKGIDNIAKQPGYVVLEPVCR